MLAKYGPVLQRSPPHARTRSKIADANQVARQTAEETIAGILLLKVPTSGRFPVRRNSIRCNQ